MMHVERSIGMLVVFVERMHGLWYERADAERCSARRMNMALISKLGRVAAGGLFALVACMGCGPGPSRPASENEAVRDTIRLAKDLDSLRSVFRSGDLLAVDSMARAHLARTSAEAPAYYRYRTLGLLGLSLRRRGQLDSARSVYEQAHQLAVQEADSESVARIRQDLAMTIAAQGDYPEALRLLLQTYRYREDQGDQRELSITLTNLSKIYRDQGNLSAAYEALQRSTAIDEARGDSLGLIADYSNLSLFLIERQEYDSAIILLRKALGMRQRIRPQSSTATEEGNLASCFIALQAWDSALVHADNTLRSALLHEQLDQQAIAEVYRAQAWKGKGDLRKALDAARAGLRLARTSGDATDMLDAHATLSGLFIALGQWDSAFVHEKAHRAMSDSLLSRERQADLEELRVRYDVETQKRENLELRVTSELAAAQASAAKWTSVAILSLSVLLVIVGYTLVRRIRQRSRRREAELEQQALRAQMDPHFLFNALNTIPGLYATGEVAAANDHVGHLSRFLRSVLETSRRRTVPLARELELVEHYLHISANRNPGRLTWSIEVRPYVLTEQLAIPPMLVQPIVENAVEHGLRGRERGHIAVRVDTADMVLTVEVEDDGVGRSAAAERSFPPGKGSLGLELVRERIRLFDARTPASQALVVVDKRGTDGAPAGTLVTLRMHTHQLTEHAAAGDRG